MEHLEQDTENNGAVAELDKTIEVVAEKPEGVARRVSPGRAAPLRNGFERPRHTSGFARAQQAKLAAAGGVASSSTFDDELICSD